MERFTTFQFTAVADASLEQRFRRHAGARRFAYNECLSMVNAAARARRAGEEVEVPWSGFDLINAFNSWKRSEDAGRVFAVDRDGGATLVSGLAWRSAVCAQVFEEAAVDLGRALRAYSDANKDRRRKVGFPSFKHKHSARQSFRLRNRYGKGTRPQIRVGEEGPRSITLPVIGVVKVREDTRRLRRLLGCAGNGAPRARVLSVTVAFERGRWRLLVTTSAAAFHPRMRHPREPLAGVVGVDLGLSAYLVAARADREELERVPAPKALAEARARLRRADRELSRTQRGSAHRRRARERRRELHASIAARRRHFLHETSTHLAKTHGRVCVEDLAVKNLVGNHRLAFAIADASWGTFLTQLSYKAGWYRCQLLVAPRFFASTKTCSACGTQRAEMSLSERVYACERCGLVADRDCNAAANLAAWGESELRARESRSRIPKHEAGSTMPVEDRALAVTSGDGETRTGIPADSVGQKREPAQASFST